MKTASLSEYGFFRNGLNFSKEESKGTGCKILGVGDFEDNVFIPVDSLSEINSALITDDDLIQNGDIIFVRSNGNKALVGRMLFAKNIAEPICYSGFCIRFRSYDSANSEALYYALKSPYCKKQYTPTQQTNITNLSQDKLGDVQIPEFIIQTAHHEAVGLLSKIDTKIDLNNRLCAELEAMTKTLYDYWFVQFDFPDENGQPYRSNSGQMEWCKDLGRKVPKGWNVGTLSDIANITMGQSPAGESYNETGEGIMFFQGSTDFGSRFPLPRVYTTAPTRFAQKGDILMSVRAPVGALNIAMDDCCIGRGLAALNSKVGSQIYLIQLLNNFRAVFEIMNGNGTTFGSINKDTLHEMKVVLPPEKTLRQFEVLVAPAEAQINRCEKENRELSQFRDWLLPMLMNGQAKIEKAEGNRYDHQTSV